MRSKRRALLNIVVVDTRSDHNTACQWMRPGRLRYHSQFDHNHFQLSTRSNERSIETEQEVPNRKVCSPGLAPLAGHCRDIRCTVSDPLDCGDLDYKSDLERKELCSPWRVRACSKRWLEQRCGLARTFPALDWRSERKSPIQEGGARQTPGVEVVRMTRCSRGITDRPRSGSVFYYLCESWAHLVFTSISRRKPSDLDC